VAEVFTNASSFEMSRTYYADVGEFELNGVNPWAAPRGVR